MIKKRIIHIIVGDKFTAGYINFMMSFGKFEQKFFVYKNNGRFKREDIKTHGDVFLIYNSLDLLKKEFRYDFKMADKIIVSGIFGRLIYVLLFLLRRYLRKMYLQFWGGDFYSYRKANYFSKTWLRKKILHRCIKRCAGIITLVPGDYDELSKIFPNDKPHYVASMPGGAIENMTEYARDKENDLEKIILLGNSATKENCHMEVIDLLSRFKERGFKVICPLSYGDREYAMKVVKYGSKKLGRVFCPILDYMNRDEYFMLLSRCQVGIFNNNRQQAMGNINSLIELEKKVFLNSKTSMWNDYSSFGIRLFDVEDIGKMSFREVFSMKKDIAEDNRKKLHVRNEKYDSNWGIILSI